MLSFFGLAGALATIKAILFSGGLWGVAAAVGCLIVFSFLVSTLRTAAILAAVIGVVVFAAYAGGYTKCNAYVENALTVAKVKQENAVLKDQLESARRMRAAEEVLSKEAEKENNELNKKLEEILAELNTREEKCEKAASQKDMDKIRGMQ